MLPIKINMGHEINTAYIEDLISNLISIFLLAKYNALERKTLNIKAEKIYFRVLNNSFNIHFANLDEYLLLQSDLSS